MNIPSMVKHRRLSNNIARIVSACYWIALVLSVLVLLFSIGIGFLPDDYPLFSLQSGEPFRLSPDNIIHYEIEVENIEGVNLRSIYTTFSIWIFTILVLGTIIMKHLKSILKNVVGSKPFDEHNAKSILMVGYTVIASAVLVPFSKAYVSNKVIEVLELHQVHAVYTINAEALFLGIVIIILSAIFHYGAYLQQEYDATL